MATIVDSINVVNSLEEAPDRLRAEIGRYYSPENRGVNTTSFAFFRTGIKNDFIENFSPSNDQLVPTSRARIFISGKDEQFRDQVQWEEYVKETIRTESPNLDHQFSLQEPEITNNLVKNFHNPIYEDLTKTHATNQLLNFNLISYPNKASVDSVRRVGDLVTNFDNEDYIVNSSFDVRDLFNEFPNRISSYSGSIEEVDLKQRNIFDLNHTTAPIGQPPTVEFPFYYKKQFPMNLSFPGNNFLRLMRNRGKTKNILQSIKQNLSFSNRQFNIGTTEITGKLHNLLDICLSSKINLLTEGSNELFLVPSDQVDYNSPSRRFVEKFNSVLFLSKLRDIIRIKSRTIEEIYDSRPCESFFIGYKIEKYLDNTAGLPLQTYYTDGTEFIDTQLKYGRKYIYKTKILIGVLGSSYKYSNLYVSQNETEMVSEEGTIAESSPSGLIDIASEKYRAYVDVEVTPSFQVLEYEIENDSVVFVDVPPPPPQVQFYNNSKKSSVELFLSPTLFTNKKYSFEGAGDGLEGDVYDTLTEEDQNIEYLLTLSSDSTVTPNYFTGIYEVYRTTEPPRSKTDFMNNLLAVVDDKTSLAYPSQMELPTFSLDNMNGHFQDNLIPHKKYYYLFRSLSYHGTPSNLTGPFCVELLKDSDEFKITVDEYQYPSTPPPPTQQEVKRIIRLIPNLDRLQFSELNKTNQGSTVFKLDEDSMLTKSQSRKIKLRVTSKHTGKKMDININLVLKQDTNSFT